MINLAKMTQKEKLGLTLAALIVFSAFFDRVIVTPINMSFKKINAQIKSNELKLAQGLRNISQQDEIAKEYEKYLPYIKSKYPEGEEVAKLLEEIETIGHNAGIAITDIKPQPPKQTDMYKYYVIEAEAEGSMEKLMVFLHQLYASKQLLRASRVYVAVKNKETSEAKISMLITKVVVP